MPITGIYYTKCTQCMQCVNESPTEITILLARIFVILSSVCFYIGFTLPKFIKDIFIK